MSVHSSAPSLVHDQAPGPLQPKDPNAPLSPVPPQAHDRALQSFPQEVINTILKSKSFHDAIIQGATVFPVHGAIAFLAHGATREDEEPPQECPWEDDISPLPKNLDSDDRDQDSTMGEVDRNLPGKPRLLLPAAQIKKTRSTLIGLIILGPVPLSRY